MPAAYATELERQLRAAYTNRKSSAKTLGIPILFTFEQWSEWWLTDDRWSRRGRKAGQLQMGRKGNGGPYSPDNVECATKEKAGLSRRGAKHWRARAVVTPLGTFVTVTAAAQAHGITQPRGSDLAREKLNGWSYLA